MNILTLIGRNWIRRPQTQRFPDRLAPAPSYRGRVVIEPATCRSCSKCAQVCVSAAITFDHVEGDEYAWAYDPARCTYCGVCVAYCPVKCLLQLEDRGDSCTEPGEQAETVTVIKLRKKKPARAPRPAPAEAAPEPVPVEPVPVASEATGPAPAEATSSVEDAR
jgi:formate hydrogenlyase subunit 6/NADH:ubiquinone oxidoreductase subunit I